MKTTNFKIVRHEGKFRIDFFRFASSEIMVERNRPLKIGRIVPAGDGDSLGRLPRPRKTSAVVVEFVCLAICFKGAGDRPRSDNLF